MMFYHGKVTGKRPRKLDFMAGSERMIRAHHKNAVFHKSLEDKKSVFDADCHKRLSKVQHDIYDVYFNEFVPLKEEANRIQQRLPNISNGAVLPKLKKLATIPGKNGGYGSRFPEIHSLCLVSSAYKDSEEDKNKRTESFLDLLRQQELERTKNKKKSGPQKTRREIDPNIATPCSFWPDSDSDDSLPIDEKRLKILKTALALTSQPAVSPEPRQPKRLRKSFLLSLRRQSKVIWEEDLLKRIGAPTQKYIQKPVSVEKEVGKEKSSSIDGDGYEKALHWRPSFTKNKILNDSEESEDEQNLVKFLENRLSQSYQLPKSIESRISRSRTSMESILSETLSIKSRSHTKYNDAPVHDMEDLYGPESSPDIFSVISEGTGSYSTGSGSYTTGSYEDDSGSYYSSSEDA